MPTVQTNVVTNYQTAEYGKFAQISSSQFPAVSVTRISYPDKTAAFPGNSGANPTTTVDVYPKYAVLTYDVNYGSETGQNGANLFNTTNLSAGNWYAIQFIADTVFTGLTGNWGGDSTSGITFKAGTVAYGNFTAIKLASGTAIAYSI